MTAGPAGLAPTAAQGHAAPRVHRGHRAGVHARRLRAALPDATILATDLDPGMVAAGAERVPDVEWRAADATDRDVPDGSVDLVACSFGIMFVRDEPAAFAEVARVLPPGHGAAAGLTRRPTWMAEIRRTTSVLPLGRAAGFRQADGRGDRTPARP